MIFTVIPFDKYNLFCDCDFDNSLENKKYINRKKLKKQNQKQKQKKKTFRLENHVN